MVKGAVIKHRHLYQRHVLSVSAGAHVRTVEKTRVAADGCAAVSTSVSVTIGTRAVAENHANGGVKDVANAPTERGAAAGLNIRGRC